MNTPPATLTPRFPTSPLEGLTDVERNHLAKSKSQITLDCYRVAVYGSDRALERKGSRGGFIEWAGGKEVNDRLIEQYIIHLHGKGRSPTVAAGVISAIKFYCKWAGIPSPCGILTEAALEASRRDSAGLGRGQAQGIQRKTAKKIAKKCARRARKEGSLSALRNVAIIKVASDALLRVGEISALNVEDVDAASLTITITKSKTDQRGEGATLHLFPSTLEAISAWQAAAGIDSGALFRAVNKGGSVGGRLGAGSINEAIKKAAAAAGVTGKISSHSLRVGSAQELAQRGAGVVEMCNAGRWGSDKMPLHYARAQLAKRGAVSRLFKPI